MVAQPQWVGLEVWCSACQAYTTVHAQTLGTIGTGTNQAYSLTLTCGHFDAAETILDKTREQQKLDGIAPKRMAYHSSAASSPPFFKEERVWPPRTEGETYHFSVDSKSYQTDKPAIQGYEVKRIVQCTPTYQLFLEQDVTADRAIGDHDKVVLSGKQIRFYVVPPATGG